MMYRALESFSGLISMSKGEKRVINDLDIVNDLLSAYYIEEVKPVKEKKVKQVVTDENIGDNG